MLERIGSSFLYLSILLAWAVFILARKNKSQKTIQITNVIAALFGWLSFIILAILFVNNEFDISTVYKYSDTSMTFWETLSATWVSRGGVMILWGVYMLSISVFVMFILRKIHDNPIVTRTINLTYLFSALLMTFSMSTRPGAFSNTLDSLKYFENNVILVNNGHVIEGLGLTPSLLSFWNIIHPPIAFLAYASFIFPFAAGLAILTLKKEKDVIPERITWLTDLFMILGWTMTSLLLIAGSIWGYEQNWSGFWAWDPVEISALVMWVMASIYFHIKSFADENNMMRAFASTLGWVGVAFAAFIARSGLISGLHTYASSAQAIVFGILLLATIITTIYAVSKASTPVFDDEVFTWIGHKNKVTLVTFWLLVINVLGNMIGLTIQIFNALFTDLTDYPYWYYIPLNGLTLLLLGILLPFCEVKVKSYFERNKLILLISALLISTVIFLLSVYGSVIVLMGSILLGAVVFIQIFETYDLIRKKKNLKLVGRYIIHIGTILMLVSYYSADFVADYRPYTITPGEVFTMSDYDVRVNATWVKTSSLELHLKLDVLDLNDNSIGTLLLKQGEYQGTYWNSGDWIVMPLYDLFFHLTNTKTNQLFGLTDPVEIEIHRVPSANIMRLTFIYLILATIVALYSYMKRKPSV